MRKKNSQERWHSTKKAAVRIALANSLLSLAKYGPNYALVGRDLARGALRGGLWKFGEETGGAFGNDSYLGRTLGGAVTGGPLGAGGSALSTWLWKNDHPLKNYW
jgi:hypothetical protein